MNALFLIGAALFVLVGFVYYQLKSLAAVRNPMHGQSLNIAFLHPDLGIGTSWDWLLV
jgi:hypothetical protein